jgi:hypothetical protein
MTQSFMGRDDYLYYRHVTFGTRTKKFGPTQSVNYRPIVVSCATRVCFRFPPVVTLDQLIRDDPYTGPLERKVSKCICQNTAKSKF